MNIRRATTRVARTLLPALWIGVSATSAMAQSYSFNGQAGYLGEWEMKATLARTTTAGGVNYDGPVTLRHTGLCSVNGPEEKSGVVQLTISKRTASVEGSLVLKGEHCRITASASPSHTGLLNCRYADNHDSQSRDNQNHDGSGVPIRFSIDETADHGLENVRAER